MTYELEIADYMFEYDINWDRAQLELLGASRLGPDGKWRDVSISVGGGAFETFERSTDAAWREAEETDTYLAEESTRDRQTARAESGHAQ